MDATELDRIARDVCVARGYSFVGFVGAGAFKRTYHVEVRENDHVALKVYQPGFSKERTEREIEAMQRCSHPNVCRLRELFVFDDSGVPMTITTEEFLSDGTLSARVSPAKLLARSQTFDLGAQLIEAIAHVASLNLVHRDIKPDNIMFRGSTPVLVDFGLVRDLGASSLTQTFFASGPGTPFFASPEQLRNEKNLIDWRSDQFSLGVTLSLCTFGYHPYAEGVVPAETVGRVSRKLRPSVQFVNQAANMGLHALIKMVAPWPVERYRTPLDLSVSWRAQGR